MFKRISCLLLCLILSLGILAQNASAAAVEQTVEADSAAEADETIEADEAKGPRILIDGVELENARSVTINGTTYVALYSVTKALRPDADVTWPYDHAIVTADGLSIAAYPDKNYIEANGRCLYIPDGVKVIDGNMMLPVRKLAQALGAAVTWDGETCSVLITSGTGAIIPGSEYYDADVLNLVSHIIYAESGNQPLAGKIAVGNVIFNRVGNPLFPDTVSGVIFQPGQFYTSNSVIFKWTPNAESVIAAKLCMEGAAVLPTALWFNRAGLNCWASRNKTCVATIGGHAFYA